MYKLHHLRTFQAVHRTGSFATAARDLDYTASAVSQQIAALEKDTGLVLFDREAHGVRTTAAADLLYELSRHVLTSVDEFDQQVRRLASGTTGRVRVGSFPTANVRLVARTLSAFREHSPSADVTLEEGEPDELLDAVVDGDLDVALVYEYGLRPRRWPDDVSVHPLVREDLLLLRAADGDGAVELAQLAGRQWISSREGSDGAVSTARLCASAGFTPTVAFRSNNYDVVRELVAAAEGVAVVPALGHVPDERITATPVARESAHRTVLVAHRHGNTNPLLDGFLATMRSAVPSELPHVRRLS